MVLDHDVGGFLRFLALFVPVFAAWQGFSFYAHRLHSDELPLRLVLVAGIPPIATLGVLAPDARHGHRAAGIMSSYVVLRGITLVLGARAYNAERAARPLVLR